MEKQHDYLLFNKALFMIKNVEKVRGLITTPDVKHNYFDIDMTLKYDATEFYSTN
ncbi:hypothetical protein [Symbiopectobacterium sp. RP]|uniref:hypothetical protein n=1 Tax=Symbiopectobacterium sp. RP TaxID=3248553 RepID=UPI003D2D85D3